MTTVPQVQITARDYYVLTKGIPLGAAIALVSVLYYESHLNPGSQGYQPTEAQGQPRQVLNPHGAYGIASWNGNRQGDLLDYATAHNLVVSALDTQLAFVLTEIANSYPNCWAAIRSTASYQGIISILVDEYEDPKNKPAEINGALAIAGPLAALPPPQPAPPAAVPQAPAPQVPVPTTPPSAVPSGLPPISSTIAGLDAAILDHFGAILDALTKQRDAINVRIAKIQAQAAEFATLEGAGTSLPPPLLQKPATEPAATAITQTQGVQNMLGTSWITSVFGTGSLAGAVATVGVDLYNKTMPDAASMSLIFSSVMAGMGLLQAKDKNVTGGTVSAITGAVGKPVSLIDKQ